MTQLEANIGNRLNIERSRIKTLKQRLSDNEPSVVRGEKVEKKQFEP